MSIVIRGGHSTSCNGASATNIGGLDETTETHILCPLTINHLKRAGEEVIDGTPPTGNWSQNTDLKYGTDKANNNHAKLFVPEHFNKAYNSYNGAIGSEIWINPKNAEAVVIGTRILNNLEALGFRNRGLKDGMNEHHLHDIRSCVGTAVLVEVCFCEASEDIKLYRRVGADAVAKAISDGIVGRISSMSNPIVLTPISTSPVSVVSTQMYRLRKSWAEGGSQLVATATLSADMKAMCDKNAGYEVYNAIGQQVYPTGVVAKATVVPATRNNNSVAQLQAELNVQGFGPIAVDGFYGPKTLDACPMVKEGATGNITKWLQKRLAMNLQDGIFGSGTKAAVFAYQKAIGEKTVGRADGIVGRLTWAALLR